MEDCLMDGLIDTLKLLPYLLVTFLILEFIEHKLSKKSQEKILKENKYGPIAGGLLGALPQCGMSAMASNLFSGGVITIGTLIAIFLSTSDEMLPIMLGEKVEVSFLLKVVGFKIIVGIIIGFIVDIIYKTKVKKPKENIEHMCDEEHCHCKEDGIIVSSIKHTIKIGLFVLIANLAINLIIFKVGEDNISNILTHKNILTYFGASLIGLIPNCASSVIITELYLSNLITLGNLLSGLLTGSGLGILLLFRTNKNMKENVLILSIIYVVGVVLGILVDLVV